MRDQHVASLTEANASRAACRDFTAYDLNPYGSIFLKRLDIHGASLKSVITETDPMRASPNMDGAISNFVLRQDGLRRMLDVERGCAAAM